MHLRVLLIGGTGTFGSQTARRLVAADPVSGVGIAGRNQDALARVVSELGDKTRAVQIDARDERRLASEAEDYDIVVNTAAPEWEVLVPALRATIAAGTHYCDLGGGGETAERQLELDSDARERDILAVVGMGLDPGVDNLLAVHASRKFDRLEEVQLRYFLNLPVFFPDPPTALDELRKTGRVDATLLAHVYLARGPVRTYREGRWIEIDPQENPVQIVLPEGKTVTAYPVGMPGPITLPRTLPEVQSVGSMLSLFPPQLHELLFREGRRISREGLSAVEAAQSFLKTALADPKRWLQTPSDFPPGWKMWVEATGWKEGRRARYIVWPLGPLYSTSIPLTVATLRILRGEVSVRGVLPPEACFEPIPFFDEVAQHAEEEDRDKPLFGESFEWLS